MDDAERLRAWWTQLKAETQQRSDAVHHAYQQLENSGLISKVVVHRYACSAQFHVLVTVIKVGGDIIARTRDNKLSPGLNAQRTVSSARAKNTLDGDRHWPGYTFDVGELAEWGPTAGMDATCRHRERTIFAERILRDVAGVQPGHPNAPTRL